MEHSVLFSVIRTSMLNSIKILDAFWRSTYSPGITSSPGHPEILIVHADKDSKHIAGENWHSDVTCDAEPPMGSILHLWEVPESGGDTLFASMEAAYDDLSERMKIYLDGLNATHSGEQIYRGRYNNQKHDDTNVTYPRNVHPVVRHTL